MCSPGDSVMIDSRNVLGALPIGLPLVRRWLAGPLLAALLCVSLPCPAARAEPPGESRSALKKLSLEELFTIEITSVSKKPESSSEAAAAIRVVTQDDI